MAELKELADEMLDIAATLKELRTNNTSTSGVHFHGSAALTILSYVALITAISVVVIMAAWRSADMREIEALRRENDILSRRIDVIEPQLRTLNLAKDAAIGRLNSIEGARK